MVGIFTSWVIFSFKMYKYLTNFLSLCSGSLYNFIKFPRPSSMTRFSRTNFYFFQRLIYLCTFSWYLERNSVIGDPGPSRSFSIKIFLWYYNSFRYLWYILFEDIINYWKYWWMFCVNAFIPRSTDITILVVSRYH